MGIQGLIGVLESASRNINISELNGSVAAIDAFCWIHRACYGCGDDLYMNEDTDQYVRYCLRRVQMLEEKGIKAILVFDGQKLPAKKLTDTNRQINRENTRQRIQLLLSEGNEAKARHLMRQCVEVTQHMVNKLIKALREKAIDYIMAPFEADAQLSYLVNNGFADFVITEDSDLLVYNCRLCLFKLDSNGNGRLVDLSLINECLGNNFNAEKFRHMCILSGCDYLPNLPGIGLQKSKKFFKMTANNDLKKSLFKIGSYLKMSKRVKVTQEYVNNFIKADNTFKYQLVFCPLQRKLVPLTPYANDVDINELTTYAGNYFSNHLTPDFAYQYSIGNVNVKTLKITDSYELVHRVDSIWSKDWISYKKKSYYNKIFVENLISKTDNNCDQNMSINGTQREDQSNKRLKVDENRFITSTQLLNEFSLHKTIDEKSLNAVTYSSNRRQTFSRNIFKVANESSEDRAVVQSKYFAGLSTGYKLTQKPVDGVMRTKRVLHESQYSLNSSGNTTINSEFEETFQISDSERSEISETSDEDIGIIDVTQQREAKSYTKLKSHQRVNNSSNRANICNYFK